MARVKVDYRTASKENYNNFCKENPTVELSFDKWVKIIYAFNEGFRDYILETGERCKFPFRFGDFSINKKKTKRFNVVDGVERIALPIDWKKTREKGKRIYMMNYHTEGYSFKWYWFKKKALFRGAKYWAFKPARVTSRKLAEYLKRENSPFQYLYKEWSLK